MRALTWIVGLAALLWSGWWFGGSYSLDKAAREWFAAHPEAQYETLDVQGFPNRFDIKLNNPRYQTPELEWQGPWLSVYALSYKPWHVIAALPPEQRLKVEGLALDLTSEDLKASVVVGPNMAVPLERLTLVGSNLALSNVDNWVMKLATLNFAVEKQETEPKQYRIGLRLAEFTPDPRLMKLIEGQTAVLPPSIGLLHLDAKVGLDREINRFLNSEPRVTQLDLDDLTLEWGEMRFLARGGLTVEDGLPAGQIDLELRNWPLMIEALKASGMVAPEMADSLGRGLAAYAGPSGDPKVLNLAFVIKEGQMFLGPFPLGPAPKL